MKAPRTGGGSGQRMAVALLLAVIALSWAAVGAAALFLDLTSRQWILAVAAAAVATEVALYIGAVFLGLAVFQRIRSRLRLRRRR